MMRKEIQRRYDMNGRSQMQGGKNWILPKEKNANRFFWDYDWLVLWKNNLCPSLGSNEGSVAMDSEFPEGRKPFCRRLWIIYSLLKIGSPWSCTSCARNLGVSAVQKIIKTVTDDIKVTIWSIKLVISWAEGLSRLWKLGDFLFQNPNQMSS